MMKIVLDLPTLTEAETEDLNTLTLPQRMLLLALYRKQPAQGGPTLAALSRRNLTVGYGKLELTELGIKVAKVLDSEFVQGHD